MAANGADGVILRLDKVSVTYRGGVAIEAGQRQFDLNPRQLERSVVCQGFARDLDCFWARRVRRPARSLRRGKIHTVTGDQSSGAADKRTGRLAGIRSPGPTATVAPAPALYRSHLPKPSTHRALQRARQCPDRMARLSRRTRR